MIRPLVVWVGLLLLPIVAGAGENWPEFRGPNANGQATAPRLPLTWSETENVRWKTPIHGKGWSSPVIWEKQVWLTTATENGKELYVLCVDRDTGKILLDRKLFENPKPDSIRPENSYATPSPVIEAGRVYVHYGPIGTACLDTKTFQTVWERRDLTGKFSLGPASSPVLFENLLILTLDDTTAPYTIALDKQTGKTVWKTERGTNFGSLSAQYRESFSTPLLVTYQGQPQLISVGTYAACAYHPRTGKEVWHIRHKGNNAVSRPVAGEGVAYLNTGAGVGELLAVRLGGQGNVTDAQVAWRYNKGIPQKPSPLLIGDLLLFVADGGIATCLDAKTGTVVWQERIEGAYSASPIAAAGRVYCFSEGGRTVVIKAGRNFEKLAENKLASGCLASPAVAGNALYLRTKTHLYRIEAGP